jgi:uncharacterized protein YcnI
MPAPLPANWPSIAALAASGVTLQEIAQKTGIALSTIKARCRRGGWKVQGKAIQEEKVEAAVTAGQMSECATDGPMVAKRILEENSQETRLSFSRSMRKTAKHIETMAPGEVLNSAQNVKALIAGTAQVHAWDEEQKNAGMSLSFYSVAGDMNIDQRSVNL